MFNSNRFSVKSRTEVATPSTMKFIEPNYRKVGLRTNRYFKLIIFFRFLVFCVFLGLLVRIFFMEGGYLDLMSKENTKANLELEYETIQAENMSLKKEIEKIKKDKSYQKSLAREHLGVIAKDELLILFRPNSKNERTPSVDHQL